MTYRIRFTLPDGRTGLWAHEYQTRETAQAAIDDRLGDTGFAYTVEEVQGAPQEPKPKSTITTERLVGLLRDRHARGLAEYGTTLDRTDLAPGEWAQHAIEEALDLAGCLMRLKDGFAPKLGSTAAHHVEILRARVKELEEVQKVMHRDLSFALQIGDAMRETMRTGEWRAGHDRSMASSAIAGWDRWKASLAKAPSVPVGASETPGKGGDSDRRRLEALERYLEGDTFRQIWKTTQGNIVAGTTIEGQEYAAPTLAALADKLMEMEAKP